MPRNARIVGTQLAYHVTHRGNRRAAVFLGPEDRLDYLDLLREATSLHGTSVWSYCLMTNHVHLLLWSPDGCALARTLHRAQGRFASSFNRRHRTSGHLWANRFYSHPVDGPAIWRTARYIEQNPVRAGLVAAPDEFDWSSAAANSGGAENRVLAPDRPIPGPIPDWQAWLELHSAEDREQLRRATRSGRPFGTPSLSAQLREELGRDVEPPRTGRPPRPPRATASGDRPSFE
jgi:putative transposase